MLAEKGIECEVLKLLCIHPLPEKAIRDAAARSGRVLVAEECVESGCAGQRIASLLSESAIPTLSLNCGERFLPCGSIAELQRLCGLDAFSIAERAEAFLSESIPKTIL